ncbi:MAG: RNA-protein complex protein Nop10 [Nitrososphaeria archaeon]
MKSILRKCVKCSKYTLIELCPKCGSSTVTPHPAKFSPDDKYSYLRTNLKYQES